MTIPVSARVADVRLNFTANTGAPAGQVAEFQVMGVPAPNPDLTVSGVSWTPTSPVETDAITLRATVNNTGTAGSAATDVNFYLGTTKVGTANVGALAAGASATVTAAIGARDAGSYPLSAKVDETNTIIEQNDANNTGTSSTPLVVTPVASSDLIASAVNWTPGNPAAGNTVTFSVAIKNQGSIASAAGAHGITLTVLNGSTVVRTLTGSYSGAIAAGATTPAVNLGTWTGRQRPVHGPRGPRRRRERTAGQAHQQHQRAAVLRGPRREHAVRPPARPRTPQSAAAPRSSARTGPSATSPVRRPAGARSR